MRVIHAVFTESELLSLRDALSEETVRMRKHVKRMIEAIADGDVCEDNTVGAKRHLRDLEQLLGWAKGCCAK